MEAVQAETEKRQRRISSPMADVKQLASDELARVQLADDEWFLENGGSPIGPLSTAEMKERWLAHQLDLESRCWGVGFPGWVPLARISALTRALGPQLQKASIPTPEPVPVKPPEPAPEPAAAPVLSPRRRSQPLAFHVEPASPPRALRSIAGAAVGLCAVAALIAVIAGPPLLSPPAPRPIVTMPVPAAALPEPPAPVAPQRQAPERRAKKPTPAMEEAPPAARSRSKARLDAGDVMAVVRAHRAEIVKCREAALAEDPTISGQKLLVQWTVSPEGLPRNVEALPSQLQDFELSSCVTRAIEGWKFPQHAAEQAPRITFPFVF